MKIKYLKNGVLRSLLPLAFLGLAMAQVQAEEFDPATHYGNDWTPDDLLKGRKAAPATPEGAASPGPAVSSPAQKGSGAEEDLRQWAGMSYSDPSGRP